MHPGRLGDGLTVEQGAEAARWCALNALSVLEAELGGLERIERVLTVLGFVACTADFVEQPAVVDGASRLLHEVFGDGRAALAFRHRRRRASSRWRGRDRGRSCASLTAADARRSSMAPRIVIIGGGSYQWVPKLLIDIVNTPSLADAEIVLQDIEPEPLPLMAEFVERIAELRGHRHDGHDAPPTSAHALEGADYVVVCISTGGFTSMRHDLEIPERYGIKQCVGDTVGPGGIVRALRNIPVLLGIARDMEELCPDAWMLNLTNPMTTLCRAVTRETSIKTVGLCHEITMTRFTLSLLLDADFRAIDFEVIGVNHLPIITALRHRRRRRHRPAPRAGRRSGARTTSRWRSTCRTRSASRARRRRSLDARRPARHATG